ncbi:LysR family transcriptional regulator [Hydrogenophaga sp. A37]|uniref:LysR family transcriptional regulator n=1 Tax=Hydrogenophaga sp. A37 TaxID=1945864 RepID=UPI0009CF302E|nr:LysR family transcriptional regulator [Hydrogenophaga sp. A37]OOG86393.1 LysR family transcriptional regulator [Hydrogenophaga sp. A37]
MSDFNWQLIPSFLAAHQHGSLLGAARALGISQPTVGRHVSALEVQLGTPLFERTGRGLVPTPAAARLAEAARAMETGAQTLMRGAQQAQATLSGTVRISASQPVACFLLPPLLARLRTELPGVQIELVVSNAVSDLLKREADIAVRMLRPTQGSLVARRIGQIGVSACAHRDYLARRGMPKQPADLLQHTLVGNDKVQEIYHGFAALGHPVGPEQFALRTDDLIAYWAAVRAGLGIGFVASYLLRNDPDLVRVLPDLPLPSLPVWLVVHREIRTSRRIRAVVDFLARELPPLF